MTNIVFVSDIHLNLRKNKEFELNRFRKLIDFICEHPSEYLILGGDIFDLPHPSLDEINEFYNAIFKLKNYFDNIIVISGNHEDLNRNETTFHKLPEIDYKYIDITVNLDEAISIEKCKLYFASHHKIKEIRNIELSDKTNILFSHIRGSIGVIKEEIKLNPVSKNFDLVVLGDIHVKYSPFPNVHYCGSPYTIQYEIPRTTGFFKLKIDKKKVDIDFIKTDILPQKIRLDLSVDEYRNIVDSLNKENLYKINIHDIVEKMNDLPMKKNVLLQFNSVLDEEEINELTEEIKGYGQVDVIDTLYQIVKKSEELDEESLEKGKELLDMIKKELL